MSDAPPRSREEFLELFSHYVGEEYVQDVVEQIGVRRGGGFRLPRRVLLILFASRSGSSYLGQLLSGTGWFREISESFRPSQLKKIRDRYRLNALHEAAQWMIDQRGTPDAFGFKAGFAVLIAAAAIGVLPELIERADIVLLRRRDRLAQAVSLVKSMLTRRTHSGQPIGHQLSDADYDPDAIEFQVRLIAEREAQFADMAERLGKRAPILYYEDICAEPEQHVGKICETLGLAVPSDYEPTVRVQILRDELSARWIERFRTENPDVS